MRLREEMGLDAHACLSFDVACVEFDERFQQELDATKEVPLSEDEIRRREKSKPTKIVAANSHADLLRMLGLAVDEDDAPETGASVMAQAAEWFRANGLSA